MGFSFLFYILFSPSIQEKDKISEIRSTKQRKRDDEIERQNWEAKRERVKRVTRERQQQEKNFWEEKLGAELRVTEKRLDKKRPQKLLKQSFPKLRIKPFKARSSDWVRFE